MLSNHCNVTGLLRRLQVNIQVFKIINKHGDVFKNWLCANFLSLPKKSELPKIWGGSVAPLVPPARTPMILERLRVMLTANVNLCYVTLFLSSRMTLKLFFTYTKNN